MLFHKDQLLYSIRHNTYSTDTRVLWFQPQRTLPYSLWLCVNCPCQLGLSSGLFPELSAVEIYRNLQKQDQTGRSTNKKRKRRDETCFFHGGCLKCTTMESSLLRKYRHFKDVTCCPQLLETPSEVKESSILKALALADPIQVLWSNSDSPKYYSEWCQFYPVLQESSKASLFELRFWSSGCIKPLESALKLHIPKSNRRNRKTKDRGKKIALPNEKRHIRLSPENAVCQVGIKCWCSNTELLI